MKRESIGIKEIDSMIEGGLPRGSVIGVSGPPGVGKSIFGLHFILEGARAGQKGVYINLEEPRRNIDKMILGFEFSKEFFEFEKKGLIVIRCFDYSDYEKISLELLEKVYSDKKIERVVIDSFNCFFDSLENNCSEGGINIRKLVNASFKFLRKDDLNVLLVLEKQEVGGGFGHNIPYLVDGIIKLEYLDLGIVERRVFIPKMRWTNQFKESKEYIISKKGIQLLGED